MVTPHEHSPAPDFATTRWSVVVSAGRRSSPESERALAELCGRYWYPLYAYLRRRVADAEEARDLTQEFFARLLEKNLLAAADPERGRFRTFLLTCCQHFLANVWNWAGAQKRGGGRPVLPLDFEHGESRYRCEPADPHTPERQYERQWALSLLDHVLDRLRAEHVEAGKGELFEQLKPFLAGTPPGTSQAEAAQARGLSEGAFKVALHRLRRRYRELLRNEVADTLDACADVDDEIRALLQSLAVS
jgi:RNA polymerase sigma factor (sigma-70 family)